jgi:ribonuclease-3
MSVKSNSDLQTFSSRIGYNFNNNLLLEEAITHPSLTDKSNKNYQRLEFLGDKVLSIVIAEFLIKRYPKDQEGDLSKKQANLVSGDVLAKIACDIGLDDIIRISRGEEKIGGKKNKRNLENALEALIGAIYLDSDFTVVQNFVTRLWSQIFDSNVKFKNDPISHLQEIIQAKYKILPNYQIEKCGGSEHLPIFIAHLDISSCGLKFEAIGNSKKEAQKNVANIAISYFANNKKV